MKIMESRKKQPRNGLTAVRTKDFISGFRVDPYGLIGQWLTDALNPSVYTYEVSPVFSIMEDVVLEEMRRIVGFPEGKGDGTFCPGGSISNGFGISCARHMLFPEIKVTAENNRLGIIKFKKKNHFEIICHRKLGSMLLVVWFSTLLETPTTPSSNWPLSWAWDPKTSLQSRLTPREK